MVKQILRSFPAADKATITMMARTPSLRERNATIIIILNGCLVKFNEMKRLIINFMQSATKATITPQAKSKNVPKPCQKNHILHTDSSRAI